MPAAPTVIQSCERDYDPAFQPYIHAARHAIILQQSQRCARLDRDQCVKDWQERYRQRSR